MLPIISRISIFSVQTLIAGSKILSPGDSPQQLGGYAAGLSCAAHGPHENTVLVVDNTNSRIQAIPSACARGPCNVSTYARRLHFPLALAVLPAAGHTRAAG